MTTAPPTLEHVHAGDGWRLAVHRYRAARDVEPRRHGVVLCHGLAANRLAFDAAPNASLARWLAARGFEVFAVELRGHGESERPRLFGPRRFDFAFDDYLVWDVPAVIAHVEQATGRRGVHFVGHSMGGLLLYAHVARGNSRDVVSGVTVGSSLDYSESASGFHRLLPLRPLLDRIPLVPIGAIARASAAAVGRFVTPYERFNVWTSNVEPDVWRRVCSHGFHAVSPPVMAQLASAMMRGGLSSLDGATRYVAGLEGATAPILAIAGDRDAQCPPDAARRTIEALGSTRRRLFVAGPESGTVDHYGHFDLLIGKRASVEVFPVIGEWLGSAESDRAAEAATATKEKGRPTEADREPESADR